MLGPLAARKHALKPAGPSLHTRLVVHVYRNEDLVLLRTDVFCRYAVSMRISDLMEEIELDDSVSPLGQTEEQVGQVCFSEGSPPAPPCPPTLSPASPAPGPDARTPSNQLPLHVHGSITEHALQLAAHPS